MILRSADSFHVQARGSSPEWKGIDDDSLDHGPLLTGGWTRHLSAPLLRSAIGLRLVCIAFGLGCPRAHADTARLCEHVGANGWSIAARVEEANLVVVATSVYTESPLAT